MILTLAAIALSLLVVYLAASTLYLIILAVASLAIKGRHGTDPTRQRSFAIVVPAHNEELLISRLLTSLLAVRYPSQGRQIFVIADNCSDRTAQIAATFPVTVLHRRDESRVGKGFAIRHALDRIGMESFDAVLIIDADNVVDGEILVELNRSIEAGHEAIQCQNGVANRNDSWFAELLFVSRTVGNRLYHQGKEVLGLSSYLMGNGICFTTGLLARLPWTAFSLGEDWEYYARLMKARVKVGFALRAKVFHQESKTLDQATSQRLRWAKGRFDVGRRFGARLFVEGLRQRDWLMLDSSLPFIFPNYSLQVNLTILALLFCALLPASFAKSLLVGTALTALVCQMALFLCGMVLGGRFLRSLSAVLRAPLFLVWKSVIDVMSFTGLYQGARWVRTARHNTAASEKPFISH